ncbi:MAG: universal stress protein [Gammaproteobacteria bacterium]|nr:universal stress protein [Gammaproteobacteria bacterium]MBU1406896.1 universal stress protein [Gammaproteobacteria bacterium]MBU1533039.1 universal stress protein [Gammaproteobacteria bacterium]
MFKRILVAVDASETGEQALQMAIGLATESQAQLRIVHAVDVSNVNMESEQLDHSAMTEKIKKNGQDTLSNAEMKAAAAGIEAETNLVVLETLKPRIAEAVIEDAEAWPADLIVIGTHGRRGLSRLVVGSVAEGIVRGATMPVLLTRGT